MKNQTLAVDSKHDSTRSLTFSKTLQLAGAFLLGAFIMYTAVFVQTSAVHNAAHDTRHSQGFPCH